MHRDIWQAIRKDKETKENINAQELNKTIERHNNSMNRAIGMKPIEAWKDPHNEQLKEANSNEGSYAKEFKKGYREEFKEGQDIIIEAKKEIGRPKKLSKFTKKGTILRCLENDSYLVRENNKILKRNHAQLKKY